MEAEKSDNEFLYSKEIIADAFNICGNILTEKDILSCSPNKVFISQRAKLLGKKMADVLQDLLTNHKFEERKEWFLADENMSIESEMTKILDENDAIYTSSDSDTDADDSVYCPEEKNSISIIPLNEKIKTVRMAKKYPRWSLSTLQQRASARLRNKSDLKKWEQDIKNGGTAAEKMKMINKWTYDKFYESRCQKKPVTTRNLQEWALSAASQFANTSFKFSASLGWIKKFKMMNRIRQRKVTRFVKSKNCLSMEKIMEEANKFQNFMTESIKEFDKDFVINTDQTGCQYRADVQRTLSIRGEKTTEVYIGDFNKVTHSYTAQYTITASGKPPESIPVHARGKRLFWTCGIRKSSKTRTGIR